MQFVILEPAGSRSANCRAQGSNFHVSTFSSPLLFTSGLHERRKNTRFFSLFDTFIVELILVRRHDKYMLQILCKYGDMILGQEELASSEGAGTLA